MDLISLLITNKRKPMGKKESFPIKNLLFSVTRGIKIGFLLIIISIQLSAKNFAQQKISLDSERTDIQTVFKMIEKQSTYRFFTAMMYCLQTKKLQRNSKMLMSK